MRKMEVAYKQELEIGPASILCCVDGTVREFDAEITRIDMNHEDTNKSFVIQVTDPELLELTGGIVQGMSGSPVIQNGKFVGAVTHAFYTGFYRRIWHFCRKHAGKYLKKSIQDERKCRISASFGLISRRPFHYNVLVVRKKIFVG